MLNYHLWPEIVSLWLIVEKLLLCQLFFCHFLKMKKMDLSPFCFKMTYWKKFEKNNLIIALNVLYAKIKTLLLFQNVIQIVKNKLFF